MAPAIWTIGHSTRPLDAFIDLLKGHGVQRIADVRAFPFSPRHPHFNGAALQASLREAEIQYDHFPLLGGRRKTSPNSINLGWRNQSFRGYADYMQTQPFREGLSHLMSTSTDLRTAIMCAEAVPWRCHRSLIADALISQGWEVWDIMQPRKANLHALSPMARLEEGRLVYPAPMPSGPSLF